MRKFPMGFLGNFLWPQKVSCFACGESHKEVMKLSARTRVNTDGAWFPTPETGFNSGNPKFPHGFLWGFL